MKKLYNQFSTLANIFKLYQEDRVEESRETNKLFDVPNGDFASDSLNMDMDFENTELIGDSLMIICDEEECENHVPQQPAKVHKIITSNMIGKAEIEEYDEAI